jgi:hypothetical protein
MDEEDVEHPLSVAFREDAIIGHRSPVAPSPWQSPDAGRHRHLHRCTPGVGSGFLAARP